jgi:choline-sulfatase
VHHTIRMVRNPPPMCWLMAWAWLAGCTSGQVDADSAPSVLLVTVDALRADRVGTFGDEEAITPTLDRLAASSSVYLRAYSSAPLTIPSHATLFTGRYPPAHGVRDNGDFALGPEQVTLAERFDQAGYATVAVTSAFPMRRRWGLAQGFEEFFEPPAPARGARDQRAADEVIDEALAALADVPPDRPVFMWVHLFDPRFPYDPPNQWAAQFPSDPYRGEIAFVDSEIGRLLVAWEMRFGTERPIVIVTAPHGESLGEGGENTHGFLLNDGTLRVPLIVRGPGMQPGLRSHNPVGLVDVAPTVLDLAGLGLHRGLQGDDLRDGGSDSIYAESMLGRYNLGLAPMYSFTDTTGRYTQSVWGAFYPAFGDRIITTAIRMDLRSSHARRLEKLRQEIGEVQGPEVALDPQSLSMLSSIGYVGGDSTSPVGSIDPRDVVDLLPLTGRAHRMIDIGMQSQARTILDELSDRMPATFGVQLMEAQLLYRQGRLAEADRAFGKLWLANPSPTIALQLASVAVARGRWLEASDWYDEAYALDDTNPEAHAGRVRAAYVLGDDDLARTRFALMVSQFPDDPQTSLVSAEIALRDLQPQAAYADVISAVSRMPWSAWAHAVYGRVLWELGDSDGGIAALQEALRLDPYPAPIRIELVSALLEEGRDPEAVRVAAPLARMLADHPGAQEVYRLASESLTDPERTARRRDRARDASGKAPTIRKAPPPPGETPSPPAEGAPPAGGGASGDVAPPSSG